jgi:hydroxyethylthiazole kinase-like uncharacterized protein yjeF
MGATVRIVQLGSSLHPDGLGAAQAVGARVVAADEAALALTDSADLVVDAIVGIGGSAGLRRAAPEFALAARLGAGHTVAVDLPSGIDPDTGAAGDDAIRADFTITFGVLKTGLLTGEGRGLAGIVDVVDIGLEPFLMDDEPIAQILEVDDVAPWFAAPSDTDYKYSRGVVQVIAGSEQFPGAALLASGGARSGPAGLIRVAGNAAQAAVAAHPDLVAAQGRTDAIVVGPGIGLADAGRGQLEHALTQNVPVVVDADGLTLLADQPDLLKLRNGNGWHTVLTPHAGEAERLGADPELLRTDRIAAARWLAQRHGVVVVLKGPGTVVATPEGGPIFLDAAGDSSLSTAGTGDILGGLIASVLAPVAQESLSHRDVAAIAASAVFVHGLAGRIAAEDGFPVRATDVVDALPAAVAMLRN